MTIAEVGLFVYQGGTYFFYQGNPYQGEQQRWGAEGVRGASRTGEAEIATAIVFAINTLKLF